jgi:phosphomannomutase
MKLLKIGISGVRGIVGETMTPELAIDFASAFGTFLDSGRALIARDTRASGPMLRAAVSAALSATGCEVLDLGVCPTPILQYLVRKLGAGGGVSITAGHNGAEWNALTFVNREGTYLNEFQGADVLDLYHLEQFHKAPLAKVGRILPLDDHQETYWKDLAQFLDLKAIGSAGFKVVIDPCNGAGAKYIDEFCRALGCELVAVNNEPTGFFPHDPEPRPRNAGEVSAIVKITGARAGFLLNSDVSRVSIVAEDGETLSEEYTFPLVAAYYLDKNPGPIITNPSASRMIEDVAARRQVRVIRTKVGQSHAIQSMLAEEAAMAGEGSGGVAVRGFQPAFDGFLTMGLILEMSAVREETISGLVKDIPKYHIVKEKISCPPFKVHSVVSEAKKLFRPEELVLIDGIRAERADGWVHIRASATEPMIRVIAENKSEEKAQEDVDRVLAFINQLI